MFLVDCTVYRHSITPVSVFLTDDPFTIPDFELKMDLKMVRGFFHRFYPSPGRHVHPCPVLQDVAVGSHLVRAHSEPGPEKTKSNFVPGRPGRELL